jgi:hypothetical protein
MNLEEEIKKNQKSGNLSLISEIERNLAQGATSGGWATQSAIGNRQDSLNSLALA